MKDPADLKTDDLLTAISKAARFRVKQLAMGRRQFSFWLTDAESAQVKKFIGDMRGKSWKAE